MKKNIRKYLVWVLIIGMSSIAFGAYMYNKPHRNIAWATPDYVRTATELYREFDEEEALANERYLNKVIGVKGTLSKIEINENVVLVLETGSAFGGIRCTMTPGQYQQLSTLEEGMEVEVKGVCTGMLLDVVLVQSVLVHPQ